MARIEYKITGEEGHKNLEITDLVFPARCACCGAPNPDGAYKGAIGFVTGYQMSVGRQTTKFIWKEWQVPYCSFCLEHDRENNKRSDAIAGTVWGILILLVVALIAGVSLHPGLLVGISVFLVGLVLIYLVLGREAIKKTPRKPTCYVPTMTSSPRCFSINDGKFSSKSPLYFTFHDKNYEAEFIALNGLMSRGREKEQTIPGK